MSSKKILQQLFERENRDLDAVVIRELLDLVAHSDRVLSSPGGSLLLAGRSGTNPMNGLPACIYKLVNPSRFVVTCCHFCSQNQSANDCVLRYFVFKSEGNCEC